MVMHVIYIGGPFRAVNAWEREQNIRRAEALALEVWRHGAAALCPHTNTRNFQDAAPDDVWLKGDLALLERCDALLLTPDYARSSGARAEKVHAETLKLPVFKTLSDLVDWMTEP